MHAPSPQDRGRRVVRTRNYADAPMAHVLNEARLQLATTARIRKNTVESGYFTVHYDDGNREIEFLDGLVFYRFPHYTVDAVVDQSLDALKLHREGLIGVNKENCIASFVGGLMYGLREFGKEGVGEVGNDESDRVSRASSRGRSKPVGSITELIRITDNLLCHLIRDRASAIQCVRDGSLGHPYQICNILRSNAAFLSQADFPR